MKKLITLTVFITFFYNIVFGYSPNMLRYHCNTDSSKINNLLLEGAKYRDYNAGDIAVFYGEKLIGTKYVAHTLEGNNELLTINIDELDCTTFIESIIALTKATLDNRRNWRDYANSLESIRYRNGIMNGYVSRLHYISDWIINNTTRGNLKEVTADFPGAEYEIKSLNFMTEHRNAYKALDNNESFNEIKNIEDNYRSHRYALVKKSILALKNVQKSFRNGDIIALTTKIKGLDVSHLGLIKIVDGVPYLLNASSKDGIVEIDKNSLAQMLSISKSVTGIRVFRIINY